MAHTIEIQFYNTFIIRNISGALHFEESRIKGGFNEPFVSIGPKAHLVDENFQGNRRGNALIYSGIYNSKTDVNRTNVFSSAEAITRAVDPSNGDIHKLYAEDTNLNILQENKVSYALIDKDALFTAEGGRLTASGAAVIGQIVPYQGEYGTLHPESFAIKGIRKYFVDKNRAAVLRLSRDGITEISNYGMRDWFRDHINLVDANDYPNDKIVGMYDDHDDQYVVSLQGLSGSVDGSSVNEYYTLSFDDSVNGWVSFYDYRPEFGFSYNKKFFTFNMASQSIGANLSTTGDNLYEHYILDSNRNTFYGLGNSSYITFIANANPSVVKNFLAIDYEGDSYWAMESSNTESISAAKIDNSELSLSGDIINQFVKKEDKYYSHIKNNTGVIKGGIVGVDTAGISGTFSKVQMSNGHLSGSQELFSVSHNIVKSS